MIVPIFSMSVRRTTTPNAELLELAPFCEPLFKAKPFDFQRIFGTCDVINRNIASVVYKLRLDTEFKGDQDIEGALEGHAYDVPEWVVLTPNTQFIPKGVAMDEDDDEEVDLAKIAKLGLVNLKSTDPKVEVEIQKKLRKLSLEENKLSEQMSEFDVTNKANEARIAEMNKRNVEMAASLLSKQKQEVVYEEVKENLQKTVAALKAENWTNKHSIQSSVAMIESLAKQLEQSNQKRLAEA